MSVFRCYAEKKPGFDVEAQGLWKQLREQLGLESLEGVRILNRYDADRIAPEVYQAAKTVVFSEPQVDDVYDETFPEPQEAHAVLAVEALPGQFDQRADSCAQCIQLMAGVDRPLIAYAKVYLLEGELPLGQALPYGVGGFLGGVLAGRLLGKASPLLLRRAFGGLLLAGGVKALFFP